MIFIRELNAQEFRFSDRGHIILNKNAQVDCLPGKDKCQKKEFVHVSYNFIE